MEDTESPTGIPRHAYETPVFRIRDGVGGLHWDTWPRIDDAIASYRDVPRAPRRRRDPAAGCGSRSACRSRRARSTASRPTSPRDYAIAVPRFEDLVARELDRLLGEIPAEDLAIQWDVCYEVLDIEGVVAWMGDGAWERFTGPVERLTRLIPEDVLVGYHLCYGTFPEWPMYEARDIALLVRMANHAVAQSGRTVDWLHMAGPRYLRSEDERFFAPLRDLERRRHARLPRHRPADRRASRASAAARDGVEVPRRLRRRDVLRLRPPARAGRHGDDARAPRRRHGAARLTRMETSAMGPGPADGIVAWRAERADAGSARALRGALDSVLCRATHPV